ncbi:MAG: phosphonate C-P lyase system protein PhnG [Acetobacteraceae bacterium]
MSDPSPSTEARRHWMSVLARADSHALTERLTAWGSLPPYARLRGPEAGLVMVRGRTGGAGGAFNLGEIAVTRCTVRTEDGLVGHAYVAGRDDRRAELAAVVDALMQDPSRQDGLRQAVIEPLAAEQGAARADVAARAAATKVQFFSMRTMRT